MFTVAPATKAVSDARILVYRLLIHSTVSRFNVRLETVGVVSQPGFCPRTNIIVGMAILGQALSTRNAETSD